MASKLFGAPVTREITRLERAREALNNQNSDGKADEAAQFLDDLALNFRGVASTKCKIYNATGDKVTFVLSHDYHGHISDKFPYPVEIDNGQWGAFLHVHTSGTHDGSSAAVVYRGQNSDNVDRDWCLSWINPWSSSVNKINYAYAEVREADHYHTDNWAYIYSLMKNAGKNHVDTWGGCVSEGAIAAGTTVYFTGIMTLEGAK